MANTWIPRIASRLAGLVGIRSDVPFSGRPPTGPAHMPDQQWSGDQPKPPPDNLQFREGYHDRTLTAFSSPVGFSGWDIHRIRRAVELHDEGDFLESSLLSIVATRYGPIFAALSQAVAPALSLPRHINGGTRGLSRVLRDEVEAMIAPRDGLAPSPYFPPSLWGTSSIDLRIMGFFVWQHVYGDEDHRTGVRPMYTRRWPSWAIRYYPWRRTYVALTSDGPVDIITGDGKWTLGGDTESPHFDGAIRALGLEVLDGAMAKAARASYVDKYGNPKWIGEMPEGVAVRSPEGQEFYRALSTMRGPDGFGAFPHGSKVTIEGLTASQSNVFKDALDNVWQNSAAILLGSDGTMTRGTGVYSAPIFAGVRRDLVDRMLKIIVRGANAGCISPWLAFNYAMSIAMASGWVSPVLDVPLPDPDADARIKSYSDRVKTFHEIIEKERAVGFLVDQERVSQLCSALSIDEPRLLTQDAIASQIQLTKEDAAKIVTVDQARKARGMDPLGDDRGNMLVASVVAPAETTKAVEAVKDPDTNALAADRVAAPKESSTEPTDDGAKDGESKE